MTSSRLIVVAYHYVRDLPNTRFPRIKGLLTSGFVQQLDVLAQRYEMATLESATAFLDGDYHPRRDLCLLTFDDGLKDHHTTVLPLLAERRVEGSFFVVTSCLEHRTVAPVHKSHFLMAAMDIAEYRRRFIARLADLAPDVPIDVDCAAAQRTYRWDEPDAARFKYLINFQLEAPLRDRVLAQLFEEQFGDETAFADDLYLSWDDARAMQSAGMVIGGHTHGHRPLSTLDEQETDRDLQACTSLLRSRLAAQARRPFSYPYGKSSSFAEYTVDAVRSLGFCCAFTTELGSNDAAADRFRLRRIDTNDVGAFEARAS